MDLKNGLWKLLFPIFLIGSLTFEGDRGDYLEKQSLTRDTRFTISTNWVRNFNSFAINIPVELNNGGRTAYGSLYDKDIFSDPKNSILFDPYSLNRGIDSSKPVMEFTWKYKPLWSGSLK